jgi:Family of unknown function (DUF6502)
MAMSQNVTAAVNTATLRMLEPLAHLLLEARIGIGEFSALARLAYVKAAVQQAQESRSGRVNVSRIAATTGLTRVEVAALLAEQRGAPPRKQRGRVRAERVLQGWWSDPQFQDRSGAPARLPRKGARRSFVALVKRHSGDSHNTAPILEELLRSQAVREHADGTLEAVSRTCVTVGWDEEGIEALGEELAEHIETLLYNLKNPDRPRFAKRIVCGDLDPYAARVIVPELAEQAEIFLEGAQDTLNRPKHPSHKRHSQATALRFAVALQFFQAPAPRSGPKTLGPAVRRKRSAGGGRAGAMHDPGVV